MKPMQNLLTLLIYFSSISKSQSKQKSPINQFFLLGPVQNPILPLDDLYQQLTDLNNFKFLESPPICNNVTQSLLVIIVPSKWSYFEKRMVIRKSWGRPVTWTRVLYLIGEPDPWTMSFHDVHREAMVYGDIIMGNFVDSYGNLTYKHVMGLKWVSHHCSTAKYVLKVDDDVIVDLDMVRQFLVQTLSPWGARELIACNRVEDAPVPRSNEAVMFRDKNHFVSYEEYPNEYYPLFCFGWVILYSQDSVRSLLKASRSAPFLWVDDVFVTGVCAQQASLIPTPLDVLILSWKLEFMREPLSGRRVDMYNDLILFRLKHDWSQHEASGLYGN
ncbi:beta-1,3-galactosyltransferase 5-like [Amyelois transitella]|uniref:beta-1,3-galactosyltransferase 5-like n=1 Tax=Amyelois transitella TaxID=680683 RepID=UPI00298F6713|nr:beta-1,3-galactosyltransferase 5-like [Amyelois transitella]